MSFGPRGTATDASAATAAARLVRSRVAAGDRVALLAGPSVASVVALRAIAACGATALPLGTRLTGRELAAIVGLARPALVIHDDATAPTAAALGMPALGLGVAETRGSVPGRVLDASPVPGDLLVATSGTTASPKLAHLRGDALAASVASWSAFLPPAGGWLLALGLGHVAGIGVVWRAAVAGVPLVVSPSDPAAILAALRAHPEATHVSLVPAQLARLLDAAEAAGLGAPPTLRAVLLGGGQVPPALVTRALAAGWPVAPTYGMTETASGVTALPPGDAATRPASAGRPLPGVELRIGAAGADGAGEIEVRTASLFAGYLGDDAATAAALTADGWYRTGDVGRLDAEGYLTVLDRRTDLVVSGGENVAPAEVEAVLLDHPAVADAGVVGRPDPTWGAVPVAALVLRPGAADPGDDALRAHCRERLAAYKVPAAFVRVASLPRTSGGKLRRAALREALG